LKSLTVHKALRYLLAFGTLGYGVASLAKSQRFAELTSMDDEAVQKMAMRDIGSGLALLTAARPTGVLIGLAISDFGDGAKLLRKKPQLAPVAFIWGLLAVAAIVTRPRGQATAEA